MKRSIVFTALLTGFIISVFAQSAGDFEYITENGSITITGYKGSEMNITIPEKINGLPVSAIGARAFHRLRLTGINFPNTITVIGNNAFSYNRLTKLTFPESLVTIDYMAFAKNRLTEINLPGSITFIGIGAFTENRIKNVDLPVSLIYIGDRSFTRNYLNTVIVSNSVGWS